MRNGDTICALATPPGIGGIAVVRLSGPDALAIADCCFRGKKRLREVATHTIHYGRFVWGEELVDMVTASVFHAPHSYTGEDTVEFGCHGGVLVAEAVVEALIEAGARLAEPGEFTRRAFLNGKLDLVQVEAVADLIYATSVPGARLAARQLLGGLTQQLRELRQQLVQTAALLELELDFAEEELEFVSRPELLLRLEQGQQWCQRLADSYRAAEILRSGFLVGCVGYPNAGKSSLFNALLQRHRAIVSPIPGTTRDYLEEGLYLQGIPIRLLDTAGVRETDDVVELEGIALAEQAVRQCNVLLIINDVTQGDGHSVGLLQELQHRFPEALCVYVQNKIDLLSDGPLGWDAGSIRVPVFWLSALRGDGIEELRRWLGEQARRSSELSAEVLLSARQARVLREVAQSLAAAREALLHELPGEFVAADLRHAVELL
ncbi:MAG: tRNA uridine-5-carboxymethylaminomethyl(34) synthesis GTPase MnmE, partial [Bacteroidota bacterium]|nr:tRNA uridine-5-carboxymethylaminomethyl(34) synthesis GTPase MnmE [Bacteroidota bacterium]